jgi:hypothetical protein
LVWLFAKIFCTGPADLWGSDLIHYGNVHIFWHKTHLNKGYTHWLEVGALQQEILLEIFPYGRMLVRILKFEFVQI